MSLQSLEASVCFQLPAHVRLHKKPCGMLSLQHHPLYVRKFHLAVQHHKAAHCYINQLSDSDNAKIEFPNPAAATEERNSHGWSSHINPGERAAGRKTPELMLSSSHICKWSECDGDDWRGLYSIPWLLTVRGSRSSEDTRECKNGWGWIDWDNSSFYSP